jgi:hypothetical protein
MSNYENEEILTGGNVSNVSRSGDTVRRELKPDSYKIHKLLKHLENKGFSYAPKFLGIDEKGREILKYCAIMILQYTTLFLSMKDQ